MIPVTTETEMPRTWATVGCNDCGESWTVDAAEFTPQLTASDVEQLLAPDLDAHVCVGGWR
jgi:hypothetical protein